MPESTERFFYTSKVECFPCEATSNRHRGLNMADSAMLMDGKPKHLIGKKQKKTDTSKTGLVESHKYLAGNWAQQGSPTNFVKEKIFPKPVVHLWASGNKRFRIVSIHRTGATVSILGRRKWWLDTLRMAQSSTKMLKLELCLEQLMHWRYALLARSQLVLFPFLGVKSSCKNVSHATCLDYFLYKTLKEQLFHAVHKLVFSIIVRMLCTLFTS